MAFVAKAELQGRWLARWFLRRIHAEFVKRFEVSQGIADARRLEGLAREGVGLLFFPEGTFTRSPGLGTFHLGAFVTAASCELPVIPVTLQGTRSVLRSAEWFPHRGPVGVVIGRTLAPSGNGWEAAINLRDRARRAILENLNEPDLAR
jgi:1-acyl-sn-glycerol-3-phosphate acyltransferase